MKLYYRALIVVFLLVGGALSFIDNNRFQLFEFFIILMIFVALEIVFSIFESK